MEAQLQAHGGGMPSAAAAGVTIERLLERTAQLQGCTFFAGGDEFVVEQLFREPEFSFLPMVALQAVRLGRPLGADMDAQMHLIGAECHINDAAPLGIEVTVRALHGNELGTLRAILFQKAADEVFRWTENSAVDLQAVFQNFMEGYENERLALEHYTAQIQAARQDALVRQARQSQTMESIS